MKRKSAMAACLLLLFCSCKKDRMCECTSLNSSEYVDASGKKTTEEMASVTTVHRYSSVRKGDIATQCGNSSSKSENTSTDQGNVSSSAYKTETKCEIK